MDKSSGKVINPDPTGADFTSSPQSGQAPVKITVGKRATMKKPSSPSRYRDKKL